MRIVSVCLIAIIVSINSAFAAVETEKNKVASTLSSEHVLNWSFGLIVVLGVFFTCIWFLRKMGALPVNSKTGLRVIAGLSLGMREKLILVQVGDKQLLLGVAPGRVNNLLVLEGTEQLYKEKHNEGNEGEFAQKLKQLIAGSQNE